MPFYPGEVANDLRNYTEEIREYAGDDEHVVASYRNALRDALAEYDAPTDEWNRSEGPVVRFERSASWENHETVNRFAKDVLEGKTTIAADGSEIGPTEEFTVPFGLVQVAWTANHHHPDGDYDSDVSSHVLGPQTVTEQAEEGGMRLSLIHI